MASSTIYASETESDETKTTIDFPSGRTVGNEKCFELDAYKSLALIYAHYSSCEAQKHFVFKLMNTVDEKQTALQESADRLAIALSTLEEERASLVVAATTQAEIAEREARRKRIWRGFAVGGIVVSLALGATVAVIGAVR